VLELGGESAVDLYRCFGFPLDDLAAQSSSFLSETDDLYERALDKLLELRLGLRLDQVARYDTPGSSGEALGYSLPGAHALGAQDELAGLGIDLRGQQNVEIDVASRPSKTPRAFCGRSRYPAGSCS